jgi:hypothetical protein
MSFFSDIEKMKIETLSAIKTVTDGSPDHEHLSQKLSIINGIISYVAHGTWAKDGTRKRVTDALNAKGGKGYEACAKHYRCSVESIKSSVHNANIKIRERLGYPHIDILSLINSGKLDEAEFILMCRTAKKPLQQLFPMVVLDEFPEEYRMNKVSSKKFIDDLRTLRGITIGSLQDFMRGISPDTLSLISYLFRANDPAVITQQMLVFQYLMRGMETADLAQRLGMNVEKLDL